MVLRYDIDFLKEKIKVKVKYSIILFLLFLVIFIISIIFDLVVLAFISYLLFLFAMGVLLTICPYSMKIEEENKYRKIESYIKKWENSNNNVKFLYKMYLDNVFENNFNNVLIYTFINLTEETFEFEINKNDEKLVMIFYYNKVEYCQIKTKKYQYSENVKWYSKKIKFINEDEILEFVTDMYNNM